MMVLITYDVSTQSADGRKRLSRLAKQCVNYGQRVQNSVFECVIDSAKFKEVQSKMLKIIDPQKDSLRFYFLGNSYQSKIEHYGAKKSIEIESTLMF